MIKANITLKQINICLIKANVRFGLIFMNKPLYSLILKHTYEKSHKQI